MEGREERGRPGIPGISAPLAGLYHLGNPLIECRSAEIDSAGVPKVAAARHHLPPQSTGCMRLTFAWKTDYTRNEQEKKW